MKKIYLASAIAFLGALALSPLRADSYAVDPVHSFVLFEVKHFGLGHVYGRFDKISGSFTYDAADPAKIGLDLSVDTATVDTNNPDRDRHLKSPDFFNVQQFPLATFKTTGVKPRMVSATDAALSPVDAFKVAGGYELTGDFTLNGVTKAITLPVIVIGTGKGPKGEARIGGEAKFMIKRSDYGIKWGPDALGDEVELTIAIEGVLQP